MRTWVLAFCAVAICGCVKIERTGGHPETREDIDRHCRESAEDYRSRASAYARCMQEHGYPHVGADDF